MIESSELSATGSQLCGARWYDWLIRVLLGRRAASAWSSLAALARLVLGWFPDLDRGHRIAPAGDLRKRSFPAAATATHRGSPTARHPRVLAPTLPAPSPPRCDPTLTSASIPRSRSRLRASSSRAVRSPFSICSCTSRSSIDRFSRSSLAVVFFNCSFSYSRWLKLVLS